MPGKILGLDICENHITAVQVISGLKRYEITACCRMPYKDGLDLERAIEDVGKHMDMKNDISLVSVPASEVSYRNLRMPFKDPKKIGQTLPYEIESMIPFSIEDVIVDFSIFDQGDQSEILVVAVKKENISAPLEVLRRKGINPDVMDIHCIPTVSYLLNQDGISDNGIFLEFGLNRNTMVLFSNKKIALIRNYHIEGEGLYETDNDGSEPKVITAEMIELYLKPFVTLVQQTIHSFGWKRNKVIYPEKIFYTGIGSRYPGTGEILTRFLELPAVRIDLRRDKRINMNRDVAAIWSPGLMDNALALAIRGSKKGHGFNLRKGEFEVHKDYLGLWRGIRKIAVFIVLILILLAADIGVDYYFLQKRYNSLKQQSEEMFLQVFPDVKRVQDPLHEMRVRIDELKRSSTSLPVIRSEQRVLDLLRDISQRISNSHDILLTDMVIDSESVRINGETDTFNTVDSIKNELEPSDYFSNITISSAKLDRTGKRVQFEMRLQRAI